MSLPKVAIATLIKTKKNFDYRVLIKRNRSLNGIANTYSNVDFIIFHEDSLTIDDKLFIQTCTDYPLKFISVQAEFNVIEVKESNFCFETDLSKEFSDGYRNMCKFWFTGFFKYVEEYDKIIRFDEDCVLVKDIPPDYFTVMGDPFRVASTFPDLDDVNVGLKAFYDGFCEENNLEITWNNTKRIPYTNFVCFRPGYFINNELFRKFVEAVYNTHCIEVNRWGDSSVWALTLHVLNMHETLYKSIANPPELSHLPPSGIIDRRMVYFHSSHEFCSDTNGKVNYK
jgi:lipopolysaccharide biosynthesis glycosyltransferase